MDSLGFPYEADHKTWQYDRPMIAIEGHTRHAGFISFY